VRRSRGESRTHSYTHAHSNNNQHTISFSIFAGQRGVGHHGYAGALQLRQPRSILLIWIHSGILSGHRRVDPTPFLKGTHAHSNNNQHTISFSIFAGRRGVGHHGYAGALQLNHPSKLFFVLGSFGILLACAGPGGSRVPIHIAPFLIVSFLLMCCFPSQPESLQEHHSVSNVPTPTATATKTQFCLLWSQVKEDPDITGTPALFSSGSPDQYY